MFISLLRGECTRMLVANFSGISEVYYSTFPDARDVLCFHGIIKMKNSYLQVFEQVSAEGPPHLPADWTRL